jgi:nitronate monooxygenase
MKLKMSEAMKNQGNKPAEHSGSSLPELKIKGKTIRLPIIQGGMGVGVSLHRLASAVAVLGGAGVVSSAALDVIVSAWLGKKVNSYEAAYREITEAKNSGGYIGMNIMIALVRDYEESVKGALDAGVDAIISGAGLPLSLPSIQPPPGYGTYPYCIIGSRTGGYL